MYNLSQERWTYSNGYKFDKYLYSGLNFMFISLHLFRLFLRSIVGKN